MADNQIRLLSLNCWGLKFVSKVREERLEAIAHELSILDHDIVALQEIWVFADYLKVQERIAKRLPHSKFFYGGALGAGLAIFSKWPMIQTSVHPYSLNGAPIDVGGGDWFVGKAAASAVILHPVLGQVQVFNTHLYAKGGEDGPEHLRAHRLVGAWEFAKLARTAAELGRYVICLGDFNSIPPTLPMTIIQEHASLTDAWVVTHPNSESLSPTSHLEAVEQLGITADNLHNTWSAGKSYITGWGKRLDYVLYRQPARPHLSAASGTGETNAPVLRATQCKVVFTDHVPGQTYSYSDHFGLEATLSIEAPTPSSPSFSSTPQKELSSAAIATTIQAWTSCYRFAKQRMKKELAIFGVSLFLIVAIAIGTAWLPYPWLTPIFVVVTAVLGWLGTTMLYEGFLFGNWECRALMNAIEDLEHHRKGLQLAGAPGHRASQAFTEQP